MTIGLLLLLLVQNRSRIPQHTINKFIRKARIKQALKKWSRFWSISKERSIQSRIQKYKSIESQKFRYQNVDDDFKEYTGPMKQPFKNIQILGTLYLCAKNEVVQDFQDINANDDVVQHVKAEQVLQIDTSKRSIGSDLAVQQQQQQSCQEAELICNKIKSIIRNLRTKLNH